MAFRASYNPLYSSVCTPLTDVNILNLEMSNIIKPGLHTTSKVSHCSQENNDLIRGKVVEEPEMSIGRSETTTWRTLRKDLHLKSL